MNFVRTIGLPPARGRDRGNRKGEVPLEVPRCGRKAFLWDMAKPVIVYVGIVSLLALGSIGASRGGGWS